jgi:hypothetical protein
LHGQGRAHLKEAQRPHAYALEALERGANVKEEGDIRGHAGGARIEVDDISYALPVAVDDPVVPIKRLGEAVGLLKPSARPGTDMGTHPKKL